MSDEHSGQLLSRWRAGDQQAAAEMFQRYANRLIGLARTRLSGKIAQRVDPEDVVHSAYRSFFAGARAGRYELERGGDLWRLLVGITLHKLYHQVRENIANKRSVDRERSLNQDSFAGLRAHLKTQEASPMEALALADELEQALSRLKPQYRPILELRLQGYTIDEIATATRRGERTVRRILEQVKQYLERA